jgi:hypothetical protein
MIINIWAKWMQTPANVETADQKMGQTFEEKKLE